MSDGNTICWMIVNRYAADHPDPANGVNCPRGAAFATREAAEAAVSVAAEHGLELVVAELVDRRDRPVTAPRSGDGP